MGFTSAGEYDAVVAGYLCVDMAPDFGRAVTARSLAELLRPGRLVEVDKMTVSLGGAVANTGIALKIFGRRVALTALIGEDVIGNLVLAILKEHGFTSPLRRTGASGTAYSIVIAPPGIDRVFLESAGCNKTFSCEDIDYGLVGRSRLFHFGYPTLMDRFFADGGVELEGMYARAKEAGAATSLDLTIPDPDSASGKADWQAILGRTLPHVDVFAPSIEETLATLAPSEYERIISQAGGDDVADAVPVQLIRDLGERILDLGVKVLLIKAGRRGAYLRTGNVAGLNESTLSLPPENWSNREIWAPPFAVDPGKMRNASGAGDAAVAGFLAAMLDGANAEAAGRYAMLAGRDNLYGADALSGLSDWQTMSAELRTETPEDPGLSSAFEFCRDTGVWNAK